MSLKTLRRSGSRPLPFRAIRTALITTALIGGVAACSDDPTSSENGDPYVGSWVATSFVGEDMDLVALGLDLTLTLGADGTFVIDIQNDPAGLCEPGPNCTQQGTYSATASQLTIDPDDSDDTTTFTYTVQGNTMIFTGDIDGTPITITFQKS